MDFFILKLLLGFLYLVVGSSAVRYARRDDPETNQRIIIANMHQGNETCAGIQYEQGMENFIAQASMHTSPSFRPLLTVRNNEFPFAVGLTTPFFRSCMGVIISETIIATSAKCVRKVRNPAKISIHWPEGAGQQENAIEGPGNVNSIVIHPLQENDEIGLGDLALLNLKAPLKLDIQRPICHICVQTGSNKLFVGSQVVVLGFEKPGPTSSREMMLKKYVSVLPIEDCYPNADPLLRRGVLCLKNAGSFRGNMGSPVFVADGSHWLLLGVLSGTLSSTLSVAPTMIDLQETPPEDKDLLEEPLVQAYDDYRPAQTAPKPKPHLHFFGGHDLPPCCRKHYRRGGPKDKKSFGSRPTTTPWILLSWVIVLAVLV